MNTFRIPDGIAPPFGRYSTAVEVPAGARWLHVSGQVGATPDGEVVEGIEAQAEQTWRNLLAVLADAGMEMGDVVKITTYLTDAGHVAAFRAARDRFIGDHRPGSTLVVVNALADPRWLIEIELVAARA